MKKLLTTMNHLKYYLFLLILYVPVFCFAQKDNPNYKDPDQLKLEEVRDRLLKGFGFQSSLVPDIQFRDKSGYLAGYTKNTITIGDSAYTILKNRGLLDEGLALLIGHELGHFDLDNASRHRQFSVMPLDMDGYLSAECDSQCRKMEAFCDYFGYFAAHRAGYNIWSKANEIIQVICENYKCTETSKHLSEQDRIDTFSKLQKSVENMSRIFDIAYRMTLIGEYQKSQTCYEIIEKTFPSREIQNNKALNQLLEGLALLPEPESRLSYPFELDNETRLREGVRAKNKEEEKADAKRIKELIRSAIQTLTIIVGEHPEYTPATFNLACAYLLAGDLVTAKTHFSSCIVTTDTITQHKAKMGEAIIDFISNQDSSGLKWLEKNATTEYLRNMAKLNLNLNKPMAPKKSSGQKNECFNQYIAHKSDNSQQLLNSNIRYIENGTNLIYFIDNMTLQINDSQLPVKGYSKSRIDTRLKDSPYSSIPTKSGTYYIYKNKAFSSNYSKTIGLVIHTNNNNEVVEYFMYYVE